MAFIKRAQSKFKVEQVYSYKDLQEGLVKVAGKNVTAKLTNKIASIPAIQADPDNYLYIRNRSVSGLDTWGCNSNFDAFPSDELQTAYESFVRVGISIDHINNGEEDLIGLVLDSEYVPKQLYCINDNTLYPFSEEKRASLLKEGKKLKVVGDYVENLLCIDKKLANEKRAGLVEAILNGEVTDTSMGCSVQESECSICGNRAKSERDYCEHIKCKRCGNRPPVDGKECAHSSDKGRMISHNGLNPKLCYEINRGLDFFEDSVILSEAFAKKSGTSAKAGGEGADTGAKILEVVASKKPSILDAIKKQSNVGTLSDDTVVIGEEPKELEQKREEYEESREDYFEGDKTSMKIEDKVITSSKLNSIIKNNKDYKSFEAEVSKIVGEISTPSRIKLRSFYKTCQERHRDEVLAVAKHIVDTQDGINQESLKERLASHGFNEHEIDEALAYQVKVKGNYDVSAKLKNFLVEGMKLYNEIDKTADLQGANYANEMHTGLAELVDRYNDSKMDDTGDLNETKGSDGKNYIGSEPIGETRAIKKTADLKSEILQFVNGQSEVPKENIFGRFGYEPEVNQAIEDLLTEGKVTVDEFETVHPVTDDINNAMATAESEEGVSVLNTSGEDDSFADVQAFEKYITSPQSDWVILSATDQSKTTDANGNSVPAYLNPENIEANQKLLTDIKALGLDAVEAQGVYLDNPEGISYLIDGASLKDGVFLGIKYNQESILIPQGIYTLPKIGSETLKSPNDVSEALIQRGELAPVTTSGGQPKVYWGDSAKEQDGYTVLNIGGEDVAFSLDIDWNGIKPFGQYLSKTSGLVEEEAKDAQEIKDDAEIIKYTDDEDLTKESKNTMIERLELTARRLSKDFEKYANVKGNSKPIYIYGNDVEGGGYGTVFKVINYDSVSDAEDRARTVAHQMGIELAGGLDFTGKEKDEKYKSEGGTIVLVPAETQPTEDEKGKLVGLIMDYEEGNLNDSQVISLFSQLIKSGLAWSLQGHYGRTAESLIKSRYLDEKGNILNTGGRPSLNKFIRNSSDKVKQEKMDINGVGSPDSDGHYNTEEMDLSQGSGDPANYKDLKKDQDSEFTTDEKGMVQKINSLRQLAGLNDLADERAEEVEKEKEDYGFELNDEILDDKEIKGNMEETLKDKKSNRMFEDYDKDKSEENEEDNDDAEEQVKKAKNAFEKMSNAFTLDADPINLDSENSSSLGTENDQIDNEDQSSIGKIMSFLKDTMLAMEDFDTPEKMDYSIKTDEDGVKDLENKTAGWYDNTRGKIMDIYRGLKAGFKFRRGQEVTDGTRKGIIISGENNNFSEGYHNENERDGAYRVGVKWEDDSENYYYSDGAGNFKEIQKSAGWYDNTRGKIMDIYRGLKAGFKFRRGQEVTDGTRKGIIISGENNNFSEGYHNENERDGAYRVGVKWEDDSENYYYSDGAGNFKEIQKSAGTVPYNIKPADQVEVRDEMGGTQATGSVTDVKEEVNPDGTTSPTVELSDGKTYPADEHMIQKTMKAETTKCTNCDGTGSITVAGTKSNCPYCSADKSETKKSAKLLELENMDFGDTEKLSKLASLESIELDSIDIPEKIVTSAVQDSTEAESMITDNEANEVFDEPVVKRSSVKPKVGSGFMVNTHGSLKANSGAMTLETMWND